MSSPFPSISSGQSIPDERQGSSPRDFGMVPHTPQITGQRMTSDQTVPHTPDISVDPSQNRYLFGVQTNTPATPGSVSTQGYNTLTTLTPTLRVPEMRDSPFTHPDQQVPATPIGGFLPPSYQSPIPYFSRFNSPHSIQSSQESTVPPVLNNSYRATHSPQHLTQHTNRQMTPRRLNPTFQNMNWRAHTRQTPSLSSRRRLTLLPSVENNTHRGQNRELVQQTTLTAVDTQDRNTKPPTGDSCIIQPETYADIENNAEGDLLQPWGANQISEEEILIFSEREPTCHLATLLPSSQAVGAGNVMMEHGTINNYPHSYQRGKNPAPGTAFTDNISRIPHQAKAENLDSVKRRAEIERRVQQVLDVCHTTRCGPPTTQAKPESQSQSTNSVLSLFEDDDFYFG